MRDDLRRSTAGLQLRLPSVRTLALGALLVCALVLAGWWIYKRYCRSDEDQIRGAILSAAQAARERRASGITDCLSHDFTGPMKMDAQDAKRIALTICNNFTRLDVALAPEPLPVVISETDRTQATVVFRVLVRGQTGDGGPWISLNEQAGGTVFRTTFKKTRDGWQMDSLSITP